MIYFNMDEAEYHQIRTLLPDMWPGLKVALCAADKNLVNLGLRSSSLCLVSIDLSDDEYESLLDKLLQLEIDAYNAPDGAYPAGNDLYYGRYRKYGHLRSILTLSEIEMGIE